MKNKFIPVNTIPYRHTKEGGNIKNTYVYCLFENGKGGYHGQWVNSANIKE